jgi:2-dehydro-3-deoxyphosphogluconate aldolase/(4S)-4-hydroxy-2-oxoglutarate aldolase
MSDSAAIRRSITDTGILPLFYYDSLGVSLEVARTLYRAGIKALEYTNRGERALENFTVLKRTLSKEAPGLSLGIGTIKTPSEARSFISAGADFIIAPIINPEVAELAGQAGLPWIPGCMTPTEIELARQYQAPIIKLFPANILGPAFVQSIREIFPGQLFIPTGGVELERNNIREWFKAGVCAVGMGSKLITKEILKHAQYDLLYTNTVAALEIVRSIANEIK